MKITEPGVYQLSMVTQGSLNGADDKVYLKAAGQEVTDTLGGWQAWKKPSLEITVTSADISSGKNDLTVVAGLSAAAESWGDFDEIKLEKIAEVKEEPKEACLKKIGKKTYVFKNGDILASSEVVTIGDTTYVAKADGSLAKKELVKATDGKTYYADVKGRIIPDKKVKVKRAKYITDSTGAIITNQWVTISKRQYYCSETGEITQTMKLVRSPRPSNYADIYGACAIGHRRRFYKPPDQKWRKKSPRLAPWTFCCAVKLLLLLHNYYSIYCQAFI